MKFGLAAELQRRLIESPPPGWTARKEAGLLTPELTQVLGYRPSVDLLLESESTPDRIWIEFEISRADPVANHTKFASAHLIDPLPISDAFVSLVSNDVSLGRANLAAHAVFLLRIAGLRAFQMPLFPNLNSQCIKNLNQGLTGFDSLPDHQIREVIELTRPLGRPKATGTEIYYATNRLEVILNLHQWNREIANPELRTQWGKRNVRYLVADSDSGLFAPSKFCAYTRMPLSSKIEESQTPTMTIPFYRTIEQSNSIFDGQKARLRLERLGFDAVRLSDAPTRVIKAFSKWQIRHQTSLNLDKGECVLLYS
jgi:hypothetical protein